MTFKGKCMFVVARIDRILLPYSDCTIDGAGEKKVRSCGGACVKFDYADLVRVANKQRKDAPMRIVLSIINHMPFETTS